MSAAHDPLAVMPPGLAAAVSPIPYWFVIGGQAVRCFAPYRPSLDVDFGLASPATIQEFLEQLRATGTVEVLEREPDTVHLQWNGIKVSVFALPALAPHVEGRRLSLTALLATKLHAILDRGLRRDFFDLYVLLQQHALGIAALLAAAHAVHGGVVNDGLMLRALTYFDDADREARLPGEGQRDWALVKDYFLVQVGSLLVPPARRLTIQGRVVDVADRGGRRGRSARRG